MKKIIRSIGLFFDKWLITPITKLILIVLAFFRDSTKNLDKLFNKKSTLVIVSLMLAFGIY